MQSDVWAQRVLLASGHLCFAELWPSGRSRGRHRRPKRALHMYLTDPANLAGTTRLQTTLSNAYDTITVLVPIFTTERHRRCGGTELSLARLRPAKVLSPRLMSIRLPAHRSHQPQGRTLSRISKISPVRVDLACVGSSGRSMRSQICPQHSTAKG